MLTNPPSTFYYELRKEYIIYLPADVCYIIFQLLDIKDLMNCDLVCYNFNLAIKCKPELFHYNNPLKLYKNNIFGKKRSNTKILY